MTLPWEVVSVFLLRAGLVALFVPFSVYYMLADFRGARDHAATVGVGVAFAVFMTIAAIALKIIASLGFLTGIADRLSAIMLACFCVATALLYKRFWTGEGLRFSADNPNLPKFWDFMKNLALAAGFVLIGFGPDASSFGTSVTSFIEAPLASSQPYRMDVRP